MLLGRWPLRTRMHLCSFIPRLSAAGPSGQKEEEDVVRTGRGEGKRGPCWRCWGKHQRWHRRDRCPHARRWSGVQGGHRPNGARLSHSGPGQPRASLCSQPVKARLRHEPTWHDAPKLPGHHHQLSPELHSIPGFSPTAQRWQETGRWPDF